MSLSNPPPAEGVRVHWDQLPPSVRTAIEERLGGHVVKAITQPGGFSPGLAARLITADGRRCFVKAVSGQTNPDTPGLHRREAQVQAALPPEAPVPRLLWTYDEGGWVALGMQDIEGRMPAQPVIASYSGYLLAHARRPAPPGIPTVRAFQAAQGEVAVAWLRERIGWE
jgi:hypothetical protein